MKSKVQSKAKLEPLGARVAPEEIAELRDRLRDFDGQLPDIRDDGVFLTRDVAEALGVSEQVVQRQLEALREKRALEAKPRRDGTQRLLLGLAALLLVTAFGIYRFTPRPLTEAEIDQRLKDIQKGLAERRLDPNRRVIRYPITKTIKEGELPPQGFDIVMQGPLTLTALDSPPQRPFQNAAQTEEQLYRALKHAYEEAKSAESAAPKPKKPLPPDQNLSKFNLGPLQPDTLTYRLGGGNGAVTGFISLAPSGANGVGTFGSVDAQLREAAKTGFLVGKRLQDESFNAWKGTEEFGTALPAGFSYSSQGRFSTSSTQAYPIVAIPIDEGLFRRSFLTTLRKIVHQSFEPPPGMVSSISPLEAKKPRSPLIKVVIRGPLEERTVNIPIEATGKYATAVDAARAADQMLIEETEAAVRQIRAINRGAIPAKPLAKLPQGRPS